MCAAVFGRPEIHRDQAIVERFNCMLAKRLFGHQYAVEMLLPSGQRSTAWVRRLPDIVATPNSEVTSLLGKKPAVTIKEKSVTSKPSTKYSRPVGLKERKLPHSLMYDICTSLGNLKEAQIEPHTQSGL